MGHADGLGTLSLAGVDGNNAAPDGLGHVGTGVDGNHHDGGYPDVGELQGIVGKVGQAVVQENSLQHHGGAPEYFHIAPDEDTNQLQQEALGQGIVFGVGNGVQNTADKADEAADGRCHQRQNQGIPDTGDIGGSVALQ